MSTATKPVKHIWSSGDCVDADSPPRCARLTMNHGLKVVYNWDLKQSDPGKCGNTISGPLKPDSVLRWTILTPSLPGYTNITDPFTVKE
ncbi:MAG: hypothetical protein LBV60_12955 [Streptomyces sp.]|nr:hypothetical protein [Streptomyces sp.]